MALARQGYRPVPLFNGVPSGTGALVSTRQIAELLVTLSEHVERAALADDAPPAFVLDASRMAGGRAPRPGDFDNRWMVFPQDFPSASFLREHGVRQVVVIQESFSVLADDLAHVLRAHREAGLEILVHVLGAPLPPRPASLPRCSWLRSMVYRALVSLRLRRSSAGGFGDAVPVPGSTVGWS